MGMSASKLVRLALVAVLGGSGNAGALEICDCTRPVGDLCIAACKQTPAPKNPFAVPTPPPKPRGPNPLANPIELGDRGQDKLQIYERIDLKGSRELQRDLQRSR
jgi:hypothetical protein